MDAPRTTVIPASHSYSPRFLITALRSAPSRQLFPCNASRLTFCSAKAQDSMRHGKVLPRLLELLLADLPQPTRLALFHALLPLAHGNGSSAERRFGKGWVSTCRSRLVQ